MIIVSLVHQTVDLLRHLSQIIDKYVKGRFLWIVHFNSEEYVDENTLPDFLWLVRTPIETRGYTPSLTHGICRALEFAGQHITYTNVLLMSSGSSFYRPYTIPTEPYIGLYPNGTLFDNGDYKFHFPIPMEYIGNFTQYCISRKNGDGWQYKYFDRDHRIQEILKQNKFKWVCGSQWSGIVFPSAVASHLVRDMKAIEQFDYIPSIPDYPLEEIIFSTYTYNYAIEQSIPILMVETIIDWNCEYETSQKSIETYRQIATVFRGIGHLVCHLPAHVDAVRQFLLTGD